VSTITDVVFVIPATFNGHADRFADIFERYPIGFFGGGTEAYRPEPVENTGTRASNSIVFHIAVNRLNLGVLDAIQAESWPRGTVLSYQTDEYDRYPTVIVWGEDGPIEHAWPLCQRCGCPERKGEGRHDCLKAMSELKC